MQNLDPAVLNKSMYNPEMGCYKIAALMNGMMLVPFVFVPCPKVYKRALVEADFSMSPPVPGLTLEEQKKKLVMPYAYAMHIDAFMPGQSTELLHNVLSSGFFTFMAANAAYVDIVTALRTSKSYSKELTRFQYGEEVNAIVSGETPVTELQIVIPYGPDLQHEGQFYTRTSNDATKIAEGVFYIANTLIPDLSKFVFFNTTGVRVTDTVAGAISSLLPPGYSSLADFTEKNRLDNGPMVERVVGSIIIQALPDVKSTKQAWFALPDAKLIEVRRVLRSYFPVLSTLDDAAYKILGGLSKKPCAVCAFSVDEVSRNISKSMFTDLLVTFIALASVCVALLELTGFMPLVIADLALWSPGTGKMPSPGTGGPTNPCPPGMIPDGNGSCMSPVAPPLETTNPCPPGMIPDGNGSCISPPAPGPDEPKPEPEPKFSLRKLSSTPEALKMSQDISSYSASIKQALRPYLTQKQKSQLF